MPPRTSSHGPFAQEEAELLCAADRALASSNLAAISPVSANLAGQQYNGQSLLAGCASHGLGGGGRCDLGGGSDFSLPSVSVSGKVVLSQHISLSLLGRLQTPLHIAATVGNSSLAKQLIEAGDVRPIPWHAARCGVLRGPCHATLLAVACCAARAMPRCSLWRAARPVPWHVMFAAYRFRLTLNY